MAVPTGTANIAPDHEQLQYQPLVATVLIDAALRRDAFVTEITEWIRRSCHATMSSMPHRLYGLLADLDEARIHYTLARTRAETVRVNVTVVGARVEIDVFEDGHVEVSAFRGSESVIEDEEFLTTLIDTHRD